MSNAFSLTVPADYELLSGLAQQGTGSLVSLNASNTKLIRDALPSLECELRALKRTALYPASLLGYDVLIEQLKSAIAPIKCLPDELLQQILTYAAIPDSSPATGYAFTLSTHKIGQYSPWLFRQVCVKWKDVVMSTQRFWSNFNLTLPKLPKYENEAEEAQIPALVKANIAKAILRVQNLAFPCGGLTIGIETEFNSTWYSRKRSNTILAEPEGLDLIAQMGPRIVDLGVEDVSSGHYRNLLSLDTALFPCLERLTLALPPLQVPITRQFLTLPSLRSLTINCGMTSLCNLLFDSTPWNQLRELSVSEPHYAVGDHSVPAVVRMPLLHKLNLDVTEVDIIRHFRLPNLQHLDITHFRGRDDAVRLPLAVVDLVVRSNCTLHVFHERTESVVKMDEHREEYELLFEHLSRVRDLSLKSIALGPGELEQIGKFELFRCAEYMDILCDTTYKDALDWLKPRFPRFCSGEGSLRHVGAEALRGAIGQADAKRVRDRYLEECWVDVEVFYA